MAVLSRSGSFFNSSRLRSLHNLHRRRTDARTITTTYAYDALNRPISKTYSDSTPGSNLFYDQADRKSVV